MSNAAHNDLARRGAWLLIGILVVGGLLRGARLLDETSHPLGLVPTADEATYDRWAQRIASGEPTGVPYQAPLHAHSLASWHRLLDPGAARQAQRAQSALFGLATIALTFVLGRRASGSPGVGLLAAGAVALHQPLVYYETTLLRDGPAAFAAALGSVGVISLVGVAGPREGRRSFAAPLAVGAIWGVASLVRENLIVVGLSSVVWLAWANGRRGRRQASWFLLGVLLPLLPWIVHNARIEGRLSPLPTWNGGTVFYLANRADHDGPGYAPPPFLAAGNAEAEIAGFTREAERRTGRELTPHEVSEYWLGRGLAEVAADPALYARKVFQRSVLFVATGELVHSRDPRLDTDRSWVLRLPLPGFGLLVGLAVAGFLARREAREIRALGVLVAALFAATVPVAFATRYRLPAVPLVAVLAAVAVRDLVHDVRRSGASRVVALRQLAAALALGVGLSLVPVAHDSSQGRWNRAAAWLSLGRVSEAFAEVAAIDATERGGRWGRLGDALLRRGEPSHAERAFRSAIALEPDDADWHIGLGRALGGQGRWKEAVAAFHAALRREPGNDEALRALDRARSGTGR